MSKFKIGDRVKCIDDSNHGGLTNDKFYTVLAIRVERNTTFILFADDRGIRNRYGLFKRFKLATVKNTAIARAFYKNKIDKIEENMIYLKE